MTVGKLGRDLRGLEDRMTMMETERTWKGEERRTDAAFSDKQVKWLKEFHEERDEIRAGRLFFRLILWSAGSAIAGATSVLLAYLKIRG